jgi:hypothetical protein
MCRVPERSISRAVNFITSLLTVSVRKEGKKGQARYALFGFDI